LNRIAIVGDDLDDQVCSTAFFVLRPVPSVDNRFLFYWLQSAAFMGRMAALQKGASYPAVTESEIRAQSFAYPPLAEQKRIVAVLDQALQGIVIAEGNAESNALNAQELFASYLNAAFESDEVGDSKIALESCVEFRNGLNFTKSSKGQSVKIVGVGNFRDEFWAPLDELQSVTLDGRLNESDRLRDGDLLVVRSNGNVELIGRTMAARGVGDEVISHSGFTIRIRQTEPRFNPSFLCYFLRSSSTKKKLVEGGTGTNIKSLNQGMLGALMVPCPALSRQREIVESLQEVSAETQRLRDVYDRRVAALVSLRASTLNAAFSGAL